MFFQRYAIDVDYLQKFFAILKTHCSCESNRVSFTTSLINNSVQTENKQTKKKYGGIIIRKKKKKIVVDEVVMVYSIHSAVIFRFLPHFYVQLWLPLSII